MFAACQKIIQQRLSASTSCLSDSRCSTPASSSTTPVGLSGSSYTHHHLSSPASSAGTRAFPQTASSSPSPPVHGCGGSGSGGGSSPAHHGSGIGGGGGGGGVVGAFKDSVLRSNLSSTLNRQPLELSIALDNNNVSKTAAFDGLSVPKDLPTPSSTPTTTRKTRRRSNLFNPSKKDDKNRCLTTSELGSGRAIPLKQGYLYKRSSKGLNKEWKKKYVTLCDDGRLTYHPSLHVSVVIMFFVVVVVLTRVFLFFFFFLRTTWKTCTAKRYHCSTSRSRCPARNPGVRKRSCRRRRPIIFTVATVCPSTCPTYRFRISK